MYGWCSGRGALSENIGFRLQRLNPTVRPVGLSLCKRRKVLDETRRRGQEGLMGPHGVWELVPIEARSRLVYVYLFILCILSQIHYTIWDFSPKNTNVFGIYIPKLLYFLGF